MAPMNFLLFSFFVTSARSLPVKGLSSSYSDLRDLVEKTAALTRVALATSPVRARTALDLDVTDIEWVDVKFTELVLYSVLPIIHIFTEFHTFCQCQKRKENLCAPPRPLAEISLLFIHCCWKRCILLFVKAAYLLFFSSTLNPREISVSVLHVNKMKIFHFLFPPRRERPRPVISSKGARLAKELNAKSLSSAYKRQETVCSLLTFSLILKWMKK